MGEGSKNIGDDGEEKIYKFLASIGWPKPKKNFDIECQKNLEHARPESKKSDRKSHGVDALYHYTCPYSPKVQRLVIVSAKDSNDKETKDTTFKVKRDFQDLTTLSECLEFSEIYADIYGLNNGTDTLVVHKLLIRLNKDEDGIEQFVPIEKKRGLACGSRVPPYFLENNRFDFIDSCCRYLTSNFSDKDNNFFITRNSLNLDGSERVSESSVLPIQNLIAGPIVVRSSDAKSKSLVIFSSEKYSFENLERMVGLAQTCGHGWSVETFIVFDKFPAEGKEDLENVCQLLNDDTFAESLKCRSLDGRLRME